MCFFLSLAHTYLMTNNTVHLILTHLITSMLTLPLSKDNPKRLYNIKYSGEKKSETTIEFAFILQLFRCLFFIQNSFRIKIERLNLRLLTG